MMEIVPPFDWTRVFIQPWTSDFETSFWIVAAGFLATAACGLVGNFLLLRRMALMGDAISHSVRSRLGAVTRNANWRVELWIDGGFVCGDRLGI
jgi:hypothetical protein